jgi:hypothetical protein
MSCWPRVVGVFPQGSCTADRKDAREAGAGAIRVQFGVRRAVRKDELGE